MRTKRLVAALLVAVLAFAGGCSRPAAQKTTPAPSVSQKAKPSPVKIGTLPTEDTLPLWVAEKNGYFKQAGIPSLEIVSFQSAQERDAAFASGAIDGFMGDMIAAANLEAGGTPNTILTVMLGSDQSQGRFAVLVPPKSTATTLSALAGVPVGTSSATIQEYVLDGLMAEAGVPADKIKVEEVKKVPVRFELLMQGKLQAAMLPEPFVTLAEQGGAKIVADDTKAKANLSQTILVFSDKYLSASGGTAAAEAVLGAWDKAVADINKDPGAYRGMLVEKARLPQPLANSYAVNTYPAHQLPTKEQVDAVLLWMKSKGYLKSNVTFEDLTLILPKK
jgi:NitT/TauT family transport system substrate-binding protein